MLGSPILDVAIGLIFIFLLLSIVASAMREWLESLVRSRSAQLERGLRELLSDPKGNNLVQALYNHPLITSLYRGSYNASEIPTSRMSLRRTGLPSYIPKENFALALIDLVARGTDPTSAVQAANRAQKLDLGTVRASLSSLSSGLGPDAKTEPVQRAILVALDNAGGDFNQFRRNLEDWFDGTMDRVAGWYKRDTQYVLLGLGLILAVIGNIDSIGLTQYLMANKSARDVLVAQAGTVAKDSAILKENYDHITKRLDSLRLPIGWSSAPAVGCDSQKTKSADTLYKAAAANSTQVVVPVSTQNASANVAGPQRAGGSISKRPGDTTVTKTADTIAKAKAQPEGPKCVAHAGTRPFSWDLFTQTFSHSWIGWILTAFAVSFGAPFWFDLLNKFMVIRSTVKPKEKSGDEGSKDRPSLPPASPSVIPPHVLNALQASVVQPVSPAEHEWREGNAKEGII